MKNSSTYQDKFYSDPDLSRDMPLIASYSAFSLTQEDSTLNFWDKVFELLTFLLLYMYIDPESLE